MFSYYGSKSKIIDFYPPPRFGKIIEPFAGSARYSLKYFDRDCTLLDKDVRIVNLWKWLQSCSKQDLLRLPKLNEGDNLMNFDLTESERLFLSFCVSEGSTGGRLTVTKRAAPNYWFKVKETVKVLEKIRHWEVLHGSYDVLENQVATWFIDPPYFVGGEHYPCSNAGIDFSMLSTWCKERAGQVIVCENSAANWLPFVDLRQHWGGKKYSKEVIWTNIETSYGSVQGSLFTPYSCV